MSWMPLRRRSIPSSGTPYLAGPADELDPRDARIAELVAERDAAVQALEEMADGVRAALVSAGYFRPSNGLVADVRHMAPEYVKTVAELVATRGRALERAADADRLRSALEAARTAPSSLSEQDRRNCVDMSDRLAESLRERDRLERQIAEREGRAAKPTVITGTGLEAPPWTQS